MNKVFIILYKSPLSFHTYGSLKALFNEHGQRIEKSLGTFHNEKSLSKKGIEGDFINLDLEDYNQSDLVIGQRSVIRSKQNII